ncbi:MAG: hypothetical protein WAW06_02980 [bacterium]
MDHEGHHSADTLARSILLAGAAVLLTYLATGCGGSDSTGPILIQPAGNLVSMTDCKTWGIGLGRGTSPDQDCIQYSYRGRTLDLTHVNAALNCCPEFETRVTVSSDSIFITEDEVEGGCHCLCLYDLQYEIRHLPAGTYRVIVSQEYLQPGDQPLEFTIDLRASPSGEYCVTRDHYPWGKKSQG